MLLTTEILGQFKDLDWAEKSQLKAQKLSFVSIWKCLGVLIHNRNNSTGGSDLYQRISVAKLYNCPDERWPKASLKALMSTSQSQAVLYVSSCVPLSSTDHSLVAEAPEYNANQQCDPVTFSKEVMSKLFLETQSAVSFFSSFGNQQYTRGSGHVWTD